MLTGLFLITAVLFVLFSGIYYQKTVELTEQTQTIRIAESYLANQIKQASRVEIINFDNRPAISCHEDGTEYTTLLYLDQGYLCELYAHQDAGLAAEDGNHLIPLSGLEITNFSQNLIELNVTDNLGQTGKIAIHMGVTA